jgi:hypothetical protein
LLNVRAGFRAPGSFQLLLFFDERIGMIIAVRVAGPTVLSCRCRPVWQAPSPAFVVVRSRHVTVLRRAILPAVDQSFLGHDSCERLGLLVTSLPNRPAPDCCLAAFDC